LRVHGRWFSPGTPAFSTTKTGRHDIAEILLKVALTHQKSKIKIIQTVESPFVLGELQLTICFSLENKFVCFYIVISITLKVEMLDLFFDEFEQC
jgi:hypothetical protein